MDPNLKNFAVFINSSSSVNKTTEKSDVQIPFVSQLAPSDQTKALMVVLSQFRFTNSMYNIDESKNTLRIACEFAPGRGYTSNQYTRLWETWTVKVPPGTYNTEQLTTYLSSKGAIYPETRTGPLEKYVNKVGYESVAQRFEYAAVEDDYGGSGNPAHAPVTTFSNCYVGFGANPIDPTDPIYTPGATTVDNGTKTIFQSPDLSHLIQYGTDITTPCVNRLADGATPTNGSLDFSFVYKSIYLLFDNETEGMLKLLGFYNIERIPAPLVENYHDNTGASVVMRGYGIGLTARTVYLPFPQYTNGVPNAVQVYNADTMRFASENTTYYTVRALTGMTQESTEIPDFPTPIPFSGYFPGSQTPATTVEMFVLYSLNAEGDGVLELDPGLFVSGSGISVPSPFISDFLERDFVAYTGPQSDPGYPALTATQIAISAADWASGNGYGLTIGSPITQIAPYVAGVTMIGYKIIDIDTTTDPEYTILTLNLTIPAAIQSSVLALEFKTNSYTLSVAQVVTNTVGTYTNWVATLLSINDRAGRLVPNLLTNLEGVGEIHIHIPQLRTQYLSSSNFQPLAPSDVIAVVPVDVPFGSAQSYQPPVTLVAYLTNTNIVNLGIQLTNAAGTLLDFNGMDWSMVLKCEEVDIISMAEQNTSGTLNTVFQAQLAQMESTAPSQVRMTRHRNKRLLPYQFFDSNEIHSKKQNSV